MDLWAYRKDAIVREVKRLYPDAVRVDLVSGLYATVTRANGDVVTVNDWRLNLTFADMHRRRL